MGIKRQKYVGNSLLPHEFSTDKEKAYLSNISRNWKKGTFWKTFKMSHSDFVTQWRTVFCLFGKKKTSQSPPTKFSATLYNYNIVEKVFMPIPKPNFWQDAVKLLMSHSNKGQFEKRYKITILAITFLFSNRGKFLDMFWILHDICDVFKAKIECQGSNYGCNVQKTKSHCVTTKFWKWQKKRLGFK